MTYLDIEIIAKHTTSALKGTGYKLDSVSKNRVGDDYDFRVEASNGVTYFELDLDERILQASSDIFSYIKFQVYIYLEACGELEATGND
jgi:hypothetical protein